MLTDCCYLLILADACWALSYLSDGANDKIEEVIRAGVVPRLVQLLGCKNMSVVTPCLRAVGNIVTGNDQQVSFILYARGNYACKKQVQVLLLFIDRPKLY